MVTDGSRASKERQFERLMETYGTDVKRVCYLFLKNRETAKDAAQETFLRAWRGMDRLRDPRAEKAWLMTIAANVCRNMLKSRAFSLMSRSVGAEALEEQGQTDAHSDGTVLAEVMRLPDAYRQTVVLYYYQGLSCEETAAALRVPCATVRTRLRRARDMLKARLEEWYYE